MDLGLEARRGRPHHHGLDVLHREHHLVREELHEGRDSGGAWRSGVCMGGHAKVWASHTRRIRQRGSIRQQQSAAASGSQQWWQGRRGGKANAAARQTRRQGKWGGKVNVPCERRGRSGGARSRPGTCGCG